MIIHSDFRDVKLQKKVDLFIADPPYGKVIKSKYDQISWQKLIDMYYELLDWCEQYSEKGTSLYIFGGVGTYQNRPFFQLCSELELKTKWRIYDVICWKKRRGIGSKYRHLFTREEIIFLVYDDIRPSYFKVQYLDEERSKEWSKRLESLKYKPKSNNLRRSNVWVDISEIITDKFCRAQKPEKLYDVIIDTSCPNDGYVVDPFGGSGTTAVVCENRGLNYTIIEKDEKMCDIIRQRLKSGKSHHTLCDKQIDLRFDC